MSLQIVVLCLAAFVIAAGIASAAVGVALPGLDRLSAALGARHRVWLWSTLAALPMAVGAAAVLVSLLPAWGVGHDHCLAHGPHHPHLCWHHATGTPGIALMVLVALWAGRALFVLATFIRGQRSSHVTARALAEVCEPYEDALLFPSEVPQAFVLGSLRPRIHVSSGLLALGHDLLEPVLAHERVHAGRRDPLWRALLPVLALGHLPGVAPAIANRFAVAQELAADDEAAGVLAEGRLDLAEAIVVLARVSQAPAEGLAFTEGDVEARVRALLAPPAATSPASTAALAVGAVALVGALLASYDVIHHGLETLLGALS